MTRVIKVCALSVALVSVTRAQGPAVVPLHELYERRSWFELRDAIAGASVPPLYRGAVASAFNQAAEAERYLGDAIQVVVRDYKRPQRVERSPNKCLCICGRAAIECAIPA